MCAPGTVETVRARADAEGIRLDRRTALLAGAGAALSAALPARALSAATPTNRLVDLTHVYSEDFPLFLGAPVPTVREVVVTVPANGFYAQKWSFWEHSGTHMDAPAHFIADGRQSPEITLAELIVPIVVVDISARVPDDADAVVMPSDLVAFERRHGRVPKARSSPCTRAGSRGRAASTTTRTSARTVFSTSRASRPRRWSGCWRTGTSRASPSTR